MKVPSNRLSCAWVVATVVLVPGKIHVDMWMDVRTLAGDNVVIMLLVLSSKSQKLVWVTYARI